MQRFRGSLSAAVLGVAALVGSMGAPAMAADSTSANAPRYTVKDVVGASNKPDCTPVARNITGVSVLRCEDYSLSLLLPSGKTKTLTTTVGKTFFHIVDRPVMNARNAVGASGDCIHYVENMSRVEPCMARWNAAGELSLLPLPHAAMVALPTSINRHGDFLFLSAIPMTKGGLTVGSKVWFGNGKTQDIEPSGEHRLAIASGITDGGDVFGTEGVLDPGLRVSNASEAKSTLKALSGDPVTVVSGKTTPLSQQSAVPMRWQRGQKAQQLQSLAGYSSTSIDAVSPSGNYLVGFSMQDEKSTPIVFKGVNGAPAVMSDLVHPHNMRTATWINNHRDYVAREVALDSNGLHMKSLVNVDGQLTDLSTAVDGVPHGHLLVAENIDQHGNVFAHLVDMESLTTRVVLLTPVK